MRLRQGLQSAKADFVWVLQRIHSPFPNSRPTTSQKPG